MDKASIDNHWQTPQETALWHDVKYLSVPVVICMKHYPKSESLLITNESTALRTLTLLPLPNFKWHNIPTLCQGVLARYCIFSFLSSFFLSPLENTVLW